MAALAIPSSLLVLVKLGGMPFWPLDSRVAEVTCPIAIGDVDGDGDGDGDGDCALAPNISVQIIVMCVMTGTCRIMIIQFLSK